MFKAYLTIDDGPSEKFKDFVNHLVSKNVMAIFFNRGDAMEGDQDSVLYAIERGYIIANHGYAHKRASELTLQDFEDDLLKTEEIIENLYQRAGVKRPGKYFRFPYMDRGMGAALVEPDKIPEEYKASIDYLLEKGLGHKKSDAAIPLCQIKKKQDLQNILKKNGFQPLPTPGVTLPWFANTEMSAAIDSLCTFSTSDWALTARHKGRHGFEDVEDLKEQINEDMGLLHEESAHIILAHEQAEIFDVTTQLIDYFLENGFEFLDFSPEEG